jgi:KDO2-lipid IV(A) lauroyltransferase
MAKSTALRRVRWLLAYKLKRLADASAGRLVGPLFRFLRKFDRIRLSNFSGGLMRRLGPWLPEHRTGRANLRAAFPEKSADQIETILAGAWENLGRVAAEFAHLDRMCAGDRWNRDFVEYGTGSAERFCRLCDDGQPALIFTAHLANWEMPGVIAALDGLDTAVLYRPPNMAAVADAVIQLRSNLMGAMVASGFDAPIKLARALEQGRHVAMLVDQHDGKGVEVTFFGRPCRVSPLIAMLARQIECPIHGVRAVRLPNGRFRVDVTEEVAPARDPAGKIDVQGTMQAITSVVEAGVREHPEQWLWLHRRWR